MRNIIFICNYNPEYTHAFKKLKTFTSYYSRIKKLATLEEFGHAPLVGIGGYLERSRRTSIFQANCRGRIFAAILMHIEIDDLLKWNTGLNKKSP